MAIADIIASPVLTNLVMAAGSDSLVSGIRNFIAPILMLIIGLVAIGFLVKREITQFAIFIGIAIVVALLFYAPDIISNIAKSVNQNSGGQGGSWNG